MKKLWIALCLLIGAFIIFFFFKAMGNQLIYDMISPPRYDASLGRVVHTRGMIPKPISIVFFNNYLPLLMIAAGVILISWHHKETPVSNKVSKIWYAITPLLLFSLISFQFMTNIFPMSLFSHISQQFFTIKLFIFSMITSLSVLMAYSFRRDYVFSRNILLISVVLDILLIPYNVLDYLVTLPINIYLIIAAFRSRTMFSDRKTTIRSLLAALFIISLSIFLTYLFYPIPASLF